MNPDPQDVLDGYEALRRQRREDIAAILTAAAPHIIRHRNYVTVSRTASLPGFNVFRELGIDRREVKTHSAMLRFLLDPLARHGQGNLFLREFLQAVWKKATWLDRPCPEPDASWTGKCEYFAGSDGRLDLVLESRPARISIAIKNKIYAKDQKAQIARYARWQGRFSSRVVQTRILIYLTLAGVEPPEVSLGGFLRPNFLVLMGYRNDIAAILRACLPAIRSQDIGFLVSQYLSVIESL